MQHGMVTRLSLIQEDLLHQVPAQADRGCSSQALLPAKDISTPTKPTPCALVWPSEMWLFCRSLLQHPGVDSKQAGLVPTFPALILP
jgi:hypothetical protein